MSSCIESCHWIHIERKYRKLKTDLNASMTKEDTGETPARPGCQDSDTLFLVTSVT